MNFHFLFKIFWNFFSMFVLRPRKFLGYLGTCAQATPGRAQNAKNRKIQARKRPRAFARGRFRAWIFRFLAFWAQSGRGLGHNSTRISRFNLTAIFREFLIKNGTRGPL